MDNTEADRRITQLETKIDNLPDLIITKLSETMDLKIKLAISELENRLHSKLTGLMITCIGELIGLILCYVLKIKGV